ASPRRDDGNGIVRGNRLIDRRIGVRTRRATRELDGECPMSPTVKRHGASRPVTASRNADNKPGGSRRTATCGGKVGSIGRVPGGGLLRRCRGIANRHFFRSSSDG